MMFKQGVFRLILGETDCSSGPELPRALMIGISQLFNIAVMLSRALAVFYPQKNCRVREVVAMMQMC